MKSEQNGKKMTIIIVDFFKGARLVKNVKLVMEQEANFGFKAIIIDNSCSGKNADTLREGLKNYQNIELIVNSRNEGYARAHNKISSKIEGQYVLILNPDILLKDPLTLQKMADFMDANPDIGMLGPKQINDSGEVAMTVRAFPKFYLQVARRTFLRNFPVLKGKVDYDEMRHLDYSKIQDADWIQSSCAIIRKDLWDKVGGLDENYFLFMSDAQLCVDAWKNGLRVTYYPEVRVYADGKRASAGGLGQLLTSWVLRQHVKDAFRYQMKHCGEKNFREEYYKMKRTGGN